MVLGVHEGCGGDPKAGGSLISPRAAESLDSEQIAGNVIAIAVVASNTVPPKAVTAQELDAGQILYETAMTYMEKSIRAEQELASLMQLVVARPVPSVVIAGNVLDTTQQKTQWKGVYIDTALRAVETVQSGKSPLFRPETFMELSALEGSVQGHMTLEETLQTGSVSTARLLSLAKASGAAVLTLDKTTAPDILPGLSLETGIRQDITSALNRNLSVQIPQERITCLDWSGRGYVKEDPRSMEAGYMLAGGISDSRGP